MTIETGPWLQAAGALAAILLLLAFGARGLRRSAFAARPHRRIAVQEVLALDSRRRVLLLRCDEREVLLLTGGSQDAVLGWLPARGEVA
jgi:flagellar protein FliO/FliZ